MAEEAGNRLDGDQDTGGDLDDEILSIHDICDTLLAVRTGGNIPRLQILVEEEEEPFDGEQESLRNSS